MKYATAVCLMMQAGFQLGGTFINYGCIFHTSCSEDSYIKIGENCDIAPQCMFMCTSHKIGVPDRRAGDLTHNGIEIGDGCWLGARVLVLPGVKVGNGSIIGAGSVVTKDIESNVIAAGVPAKVIRLIS